jgi:hypothetical protein
VRERERGGEINIHRGESRDRYIYRERIGWETDR